MRSPSTPGPAGAANDATPPPLHGAPFHVGPFSIGYGTTMANRASLNRTKSIMGSEGFPVALCPVNRTKQ